MKTDKFKFTEIFTQKGKNNYFVLAGILGIVLIAFSNFESKNEKISSQNDISLQEYKKQIESEITSFIKEINGVGDARVIIYFESGQQNIYAQKEKTSANASKDTVNSSYNENKHNTYENEYVIIDNSGQETALIEKTLQPAIQGVAVVCSGADDISVVAAVTNSVSAVLNVPTHKICVTKMR